jgi:integrase/recombinase XerD
VRFKAIEQKYEHDMKAIREEMNHQFSQIVLLIQQNPALAHIKPEILSKKIKE